MTPSPTPTQEPIISGLLPNPDEQVPACEKVLRETLEVAGIMAQTLIDGEEIILNIPSNNAPDLKPIFGEDGVLQLANNVLVSDELQEFLDERANSFRPDYKLNHSLHYGDTTIKLNFKSTRDINNRTFTSQVTITETKKDGSIHEYGFYNTYTDDGHRWATVTLGIKSQESNPRFFLNLMGNRQIHPVAALLHIPSMVLTFAGNRELELRNRSQMDGHPRIPIVTTDETKTT